MDQDQLEKLVKISGSNGIYRRSLEVEAAQVLEYVRQTRPELYEHVIAKAKRQAEEIIATNAFMKQDIEINYSGALKNLENTIVVPQGKQTFKYRGEVVKLSYSPQKISGKCRLTKYEEVKKEKKFLVLFPPHIETSNVVKLKRIWRVEAYDICSDYDGGLDWKEYRFDFVAEGKINQFYHQSVHTVAHKKKLNIHSSLIDAIFNPIDEKLMEIYDSIFPKNFEQRSTNSA